MSGIPAGAGSLLGKRLGKYEILALLALGGTAEIYLARIDGSHGFEKFVVVKCLHEHLADDMEFVKMFLDEARLAAHLDHSNIVQTYELGEHENRYYMVMEFLAGLSLAMVVRRASERLPGGRIPVALTLNMIAQAAAGLHYAHEKTQNGKPLNIVHRDISPQNLVVSFEGVTKVVDFGIAKAEHRETRTRSGTIKGKFAYMSPEQCVANNVDRRTDVFALGVIAHELLTGRRLFKRPSPYETYQAVIECNVGPPSAANHELDPALDPVIMRSMAKDKENRYPTAEAFGDAIQAYLHHRGKSSGPGDVGRFFDASFGPEIEEHGARMRELIEGREAALALKGGGWGEDDDDGKKSKRQDATVDVRSGRGGDASIDLNSQDIELMRGSQASLDSMISGLDSLGPPGASRQSGRIPRITAPEPDPEPGDEDDLPPDRTRIESNPLERPEPPRPSQAAMPLPAPPTGPHMAARSGKFPDAATLPTMIAGPDAPAGTATGDAPTAISQPLDPSRLAAKAAERPSFGQQNVQLSPSMQQAAVEPRPSALAMMNQPPGAAPQGRGNGAPGTPPRGHAQQQQPPQPPGTPPSGIAAQRGPGDNGPPSQQQMQPQMPQMQPPPGYPQQQLQPPPGYPQQQMQQQMQQPQMQQMQPPPGYPPQQLHSPPQGYPQQQQLQSPQQGYPQQPMHPQGYPMHGANGQQGIPDSGVYVDPQHAANMMSPVGNQYPQRDWNAAAATPAKAMPTWKLAVLFIGMVGIALTLTIIIAHIAR